MSKLDFFSPQRQSVLGILIIFSASVFQIIRNFWVLGVYLLLRDFDREVVVYSIIAFLILVALTLAYSIRSYLKFIFYINQEKGEFVLEKGVFSSEVVSIPYHKIQQVNFKRNLLQRLLGIYSVAIDTAGSKEKEVEIKALSKEQADVLSELLMELSAREQVSITKDDPKEVSSEGEVTSSVQWEHKLSVINLLKLGLTSNYFRGLAVLVAFYFSLREQLQFTEDLLPLPDLFIMEVASTVILVLVLIAVGMIFTVAETFIKYYNLHLQKRSSGLQLEMGLRESTRVTLKAQRVQLVKISTNPLQKKLDLFKLEISLASSQDDLGKSKIRIPGTPQRIVDKITEYLYSSKFEEKQQIRPHRLVLFKRISRGFIPLVIGTLALLFSSFSISLEWIIGAGLAYLFLLILFQLFYFRSLRLAVSEDFLVKYSGVWLKRKQLIEMYKLQAISISQPLWYKKRGLVNISFHTAGGDVSFPFIRKSEALPLMNYLLYKIESTEKVWM